MKQFIPFSMIIFFFISCNSSTENESSEENTTEEVEETITVEENTTNDRKSPRMQVELAENGMDIAFDYGSPRVRDRKIWGDLVPYNKVWRAGADEVSAVTFNNDVKVGDNTLEAGTYGMFIIPKENEDWTFVLNEEWSNEKHDVWGAYDYKKEKDVLRIDVPAESTAELHEELSYSYDSNTQHIIFKWEYVKLEIPVSPIEPA